MDKMIIINVSGNVDVDFFHLPFNNKLGRENFSILYRYVHARNRNGNRGGDVI